MNGALSDVLLSLKIDANSIGIGHFSEPWGFHMPRTRPTRAFVHSVVDAPCWLMQRACQPIELLPGDSFLVLRGAAYSLASAADARLLSFPEYWKKLKLAPMGPTVRRDAPIRFEMGGGGRLSRVVSIALELRNPALNPLILSLPAIIVIRADDSELFPWISAALSFLAAETSAARPGYCAMATHLAEVIFTGLLRAHALSDQNKSASWLRGISDERIGRALSAMHERPGFPWKLATLAAQAGVSRATFARRFDRVTGISPIEYLTAWRMQIAAEMLLDGRDPVGRIAEHVGYGSERAFRAAFKQKTGLSPTGYCKLRGKGKAPSGGRRA